MSLEKITYGSLASSEVVNNNFEYLDNRDAVIEGKIYSNNATLESAIASTQSNINSTKAELNNRITTEVNKINTNLGGRWYINGVWWNGQSGYITWSGGLCLQWGYAYAQQSTSTRITLYKTYNDTTYNVQVTGRTIVIDGDWDLGTKAGYAESQNTIILRSSRTRTGDTNYAYWQTLGFLASGQY